MKPIKVLLITGTMNVGGIENQLMHLLRQADPKRFRIDFTTTVEHPFYEAEIRALGGSCIRIPSTDGRHFVRYCRAIYRVMKDGNYDIVHSHELFHSGMVLLTARLAGVKHRFVHAHNWCDGNSLGEKTPLKRRIYNSVMGCLIRWNATEFVACSTLAGEFLYGKKVIRRDNYHLLFNSVDTSRFLEAYDQKEDGEFLDDGWINLIQVGRFSPVKNQLFTAEIAKEFKKRANKFRILCAGNDGNWYEAKVRAAIKEYGIEDQMRLLGIRRDVDVLMRKASAFLLPSTYEGMPLVLIEAQAAGLRCVVSDTFSREVDFGIGTVTWLPETADAAQWADAIEAAVTQPKPEKRTVVDTVMKNGFDSKEFARKLCELYERSMEHGEN